MSYLSNILQLLGVPVFCFDTTRRLTQLRPYRPLGEGGGPIRNDRYLIPLSSASKNPVWRSPQSPSVLSFLAVSCSKACTVDLKSTALNLRSIHNYLHHQTVSHSTTYTCWNRRTYAGSDFSLDARSKPLTYAEVYVLNVFLSSVGAKFAQKRSSVCAMYISIYGIYRIADKLSSLPQSFARQLLGVCLTLNQHFCSRAFEQKQCPSYSASWRDNSNTVSLACHHIFWRV